MNDEKNIEELFIKLVDNQLSKEEYDNFMTIVKQDDSQEKLQQLLGEYLQSDRVLEKYASERTTEDVEQLYGQVLQKMNNDQGISQPKNRTFKLKRMALSNFYKAAAMVILLGGLFYLYQNNSFTTRQDSISMPTDDVENITLKLANGEVMVISGSGQKNIMGATGSFVVSQNGNQLNYTKTDNFKEVVYNELTVPYGRTFDLVLTDGTQVTLNAGSWIKFPVQFSDEGNRKVFLKGEAYFDVAENKAHPFVVNAGAIDVEVLGTEFNVSHYPEDSHINTVLVEGSVKVYETSKKDDEISSMILTPGHLATWHTEEMKITVEKVDVSMYTSWREGILKFKNSSFHNIRKQLERHFNVRIESHNEFLEMQIYTATFKEENIVEILNAFKEDTPFEFEIRDNNRITIK